MSNSFHSKKKKKIPPIKYYYIEGLNLCNNNTVRDRTLAFFSWDIEQSHNKFIAS